MVLVGENCLLIMLTERICVKINRTPAPFLFREAINAKLARICGPPSRIAQLGCTFHP